MNSSIRLIASNFKFNSDLKEDLEDILKLIGEGSKHIAAKKFKQAIQNIDVRNKLAGWGWNMSQIVWQVIQTMKKNSCC